MTAASNRHRLSRAGSPGDAAPVLAYPRPRAALAPPPVAARLIEPEEPPPAMPTVVLRLPDLDAAPAAAETSADESGRRWRQHNVAVAAAVLLAAGLVVWIAGARRPATVTPGSATPPPARSAMAHQPVPTWKVPAAAGAGPSMSAPSNLAPENLAPPSPSAEEAALDPGAGPAMAVPPTGHDLPAPNVNFEPPQPDRRLQAPPAGGPDAASPPPAAPPYTRTADRRADPPAAALPVGGARLENRIILDQQFDQAPANR